MAYANAPIPTGFSSKHSFIRWLAEFWIVPAGGDASQTVTHLLYPGTYKRAHEKIQPDHKEGIVKIICSVKYKLATQVSAPLGSGMPDMVLLKEEGAFYFGCKWPYTVNQSRINFGPYMPFDGPPSPDTRLLSGMCLDLQSKDETKDITPFVFARLYLKLDASAGEASSWSFQLPQYGGPSYTPPPIGATPGHAFELGAFLTEFDVPKPPGPTITWERDLELQITLTYLHETDKQLAGDQVHKLHLWLDKISQSSLFKVIQSGDLPLNLQAHASRTQNRKDPDFDWKLSGERATIVKTQFLDYSFGNAYKLKIDARGDRNARPLTGIKPGDYNKALLDDRNVTLYLEEADIRSALLRQLNEANKTDQ